MSAFEDILNEPDEVEETVIPETSAPETTTETTTVEATAPAGPSDATVSEDVSSPEASAAPQLPDGYKLDSLGRVHGPDGRVISKEEAEKIKAQVAAPATDTQQPPAVEPAKVEEPAATPFRYRAANQTHDLQHASIDAKGRMVVEAEGVSVIRQALNSHHLLPQFQARLAQAEKQIAVRGEAESRSGALAKELDAIFSLPLEQFIEKIVPMHDGWEIRKANARAQYFENLAKAGREEPSQQQVDSALPDEQSVLEYTQGYIEDLKFENEFRGLSDADWKQYGDLVAVNPYAFMRPATAAHAKQHPGVRVGQPVFDTDAALAHLRAFAGRTSAAREAEAAAKKAREAASFNAAQRATSVAPPTRPAPKAPALAGAPAKAKTWDQRVNDIWRDNEDEE